MNIIAVIVAFQRELLIGLAAGMGFSLWMWLVRPVIRWSIRHEADRVVFSESQKVSTYTLMALGFASPMTAFSILMQLAMTKGQLTPSVTVLVTGLFMIGSGAIVLIGRRLTR